VLLAWYLPYKIFLLSGFVSRSLAINAHEFAVVLHAGTAAFDTIPASRTSTASSKEWWLVGEQ